MVLREEVTEEVPLQQAVESFEEWAKLSHLKETTLEVLRCNDIDDLSTVRLLNADDIKKLPIKLGQAKLLEYAVKKLKRADTSLNTSKDTTFSQSRGSSPDRKSDSFYIVPSPSKGGRRSPAKFSQVEVDDSTDDPENSPCTIRITIETKKEEDMDPEESGYIEEIINPSRNLLQDLSEEPAIIEEPPKEKEGEVSDENVAEAEPCEDAAEEEQPCEKEEPCEEPAQKEEPVQKEEPAQEVEPAQECKEEKEEELQAAPVGEECPSDCPKPCCDKEKEECNEECNEECKEECKEECQEEGEDKPEHLPPGELEDTLTDLDLEVVGEAIPPPPPPIELPPEVTRVTLQVEATAADLATPVLISPDRRTLLIPCSQESLTGREELIKTAARRIVAESIAENKVGDEDFTRDRLATFFDGTYGSTLIRLSNDHGTLKFLVPQLAEIAIQTEDPEEEKEKEKEEEEEKEEAKEDDGGDNKDLDSISGELNTPLCDLPPPEDDEERDRMPDPPQIDEPCDIQKPVGRKESSAFDPNNNQNSVPNYHIPKEVNKFGNYMQVQMLGEDLHNPPSARRPMSPVVSQPIRWECNRAQKGSSPPRTQKTASPVRHRTPSPQRFKSPPDRGSRVRVANGIPAGTAYKASGEIDPRIKQSPPKEIVNKIRNNIESPSKVKSPPKPRSPSPVKPFDTEAFRLARKLAQEVADCPPDCIMVRVKDLQKCPKALLPPELDKVTLEDYISDTEFRRTLGMSRGEFATYSEWKQQEIKKELGLF